MNLLYKIYNLIPNSHKKQLTALYLLLFVGMLLEMGGLGILIPAISVMVNDKIANEYPLIYNLFYDLGLNSRLQIIIGGITFLIAVFVFKTFFLIYLSWKQSKFSASLSATLSKNLFLGYLRKPYSYHLGENSSRLIRNVQSEVNFFASITQSVISLTTEISIVFSIAFVLFYTAPFAAACITIFFFMSAYLFQIITKNKLIKWGEQRQFHEGLTNLHLLQGLGGVKDVKLLGRENYFIEKFNVSNVVKSNISAKQITLQQIPRLYLELLAVLGLLGLVIIMTIQNLSFQNLISTLGVFIVAAFRMIPSINRILISFQSIKFAEPVVNVLHIEFEKIRIVEQKMENATNLPIDFNNQISISEISFNYPGSNQKVLDCVSFKIKKGSSIGFIGPSGSGKSTMVDIILGLLNPTKGTILVDNIDINSNIRSWQDKLGYVPQTIYLTDDTIRNNIAFGIAESNIVDVNVENAIKASQLDKFIESLPEGLNTIVGERGVKLSGGQRQRIGIARALYNNPLILLLDEATSSLDNDTEMRVMDAVNILKGKITLIIVAHRLTTVSKCDSVFMFSDGKIVNNYL